MAAQINNPSPRLLAQLVDENRKVFESGRRSPNEGWQYVASGIDPNTDGDFDWVGTLYEGQLPPYPGS
jgi:hypothetical protein